MNTKLVEKIQKLLSLATSANEHEAKLAAEKANELLIKHNLTRDQVEGFGEASYVNEIGYISKRYPFEATWASHIVKEHFFVNVLHLKASPQNMRTSKIWFIGEKTNVQVARYVFEFLVRKYKELWKVYQYRNGAHNHDKGAYYRGLTLGLDDQLEATKKKVENETGLMVIRDPMIDETTKMHHPKVRSESVSTMTNDAEATMAGYTEGKSLRIARGIESRDDSQVLALGHKK